MGLSVSPCGNDLWVGTSYQIWRLNRTPLGASMAGTESATCVQAGHLLPYSDSYDVLYIPRSSHVTGNIDIHDISAQADGKLIFANTAFSCVSSLNSNACFEPTWVPSFISRLAAEDRCHLNGIATSKNKVSHATLFAETDVVDGWRDHRVNGGVVIDTEANEVILRNLSMPHSPRWYNGKLWLLNSGAGEMGFVDTSANRFEPVAFCPGYLRGLTFLDGYAIVTTSRPRHEAFHDLKLDHELAARNASPKCGLHVIDVDTGATRHWLHIESEIVKELYDVAVLTGVTRPAAIGIKNAEIEQIITIAT